MKILKRAALALLVATLSACTATYRVAPAQYVPQKLPDEIFLMDNAGIMYVIERPAIVGGKVVGVQRNTPDTVSLAISRISEAMVQRKSPVRTAILVGSLTAGATAIVVFARGKGDSCRLIYAQDDVPGKNSLCEDTSNDPPPP